MRDFVKQYDKGHMIQRLYVHWDVSTQCNFKCSYCYAMNDYGYKSADEPGEWGKIDDWERQKLVMNNLGRATLPLFLGLLGGEPTMHPHYDELIERSHRTISKHKAGRLYITTNGSRDTSFFKKQKYYDNMYFLWSFHPEYEGKYGKGFKTLLDNIRVIIDKGFRCKVNIMLHPNEKLWPKIHKFVDEVEKIEGLELHPHFLYLNGDPHFLENYTNKFYEEFSRFEGYPGYFTFEDGKGDKVLYNDYTLFRRELTGFKGWDCWNNNYEISYDGIAHRVCFEGKADLIRDFHYFKNIKKICAVTCPHTSCNCDGLLKIYKEKV